MIHTPANPIYRFLKSPAAWLLALVISWASWTGFGQWQGRQIVADAGLPPLPSLAWITHASSNGFLLEQVTLEFTAPSAQMNEWLKAAADWKPETAHGRSSVPHHTLTYSQANSCVDFTATLSFK